MVTLLDTPNYHNIVLTSSLFSISASTDQTKVHVALTRDPQGDADCFFETDLYPDNGVVELTAVGSLIEERFRQLGIFHDAILVEFDKYGISSFSMPVLYCDYSLDSAFNPTKCFLSATGSTIVHRNSAISLAHWQLEDTSYGLQLVAINDEGETFTRSKSFTKSAVDYHVSFSVNDLLEFGLAAENVNHPVPPFPPGFKLVYFAVTYGAMRKVFYLADHPFFLTFAFRNMFNCYEYVDVVGVVKRKTVYNREMAICRGMARQYNQTVERTFEVMTGALTDDQVREVEQLVGARDIKLCAAGSDYDVVITDHTVEVDNDDDSLSSVKFTFRFIGERPLLLPSDMGALMPSKDRIFTKEFTAEFV